MSTKDIDNKNLDDNHIIQDNVMQEFLENHSSNQKLNEAVIKQMGGFEAFSESADDIANHGIGGGAFGFTYYEDTVSFAQENKEIILEALKSDAQEFGHESVPEMMTNWGSLSDLKQDEIAEALYSNDESHEAHTTVYNALAWYAGEKASVEYVSAMDEINENLKPMRPSDQNLDLADRIENFANENGYSATVMTEDNQITIEVSNNKDTVSIFLDEKNSWSSGVMVYSDEKFGEREIDTNTNSTNIDKNIFNAINDGLGFNKDNLYSANMIIDGEDVRVIEKSLSVGLDTFNHYQTGKDLDATLYVFSENAEDREIEYSRKDGVVNLNFEPSNFSKSEIDFIQSYAESRDIGINQNLEMGKEAKQESKGMELD